MRDKNDLLDLAPRYAHYLLATGRIKVGIKEGPSIAWTSWDKHSKKFEICFNPTIVQEGTDEQLELLWRHEMGHIAKAHFNIEPCKETNNRDMMIAMDMAVNVDIARTPGAEDIIRQLQGVVPSEAFAQFGIREFPWPAAMIHDILHEAAEKYADEHGPGDMCGGIEGTEDDAAKIVAAVAQSLYKTEQGNIWGVEAGGLKDFLKGAELPDWVSHLENFARSIVETTLGESRSHKRPQPVYRAHDIHVPTHRPQWKEAPSMVCFLVDTSGSMWGELKYIAPVIAYLHQHGLEVRMIAGDTRVTFDEIVRNVPEEVTGGGGTEITPLFDRAYEYSPKSIVCFSDGYVPRWPEDVGIRTLWVGTQAAPPWGEVAKSKE